MTTWAQVVEAFYDELVPTPRDSWALRESVIPLPTDGFTKVQLVGTTGAGKTTLLRQFIGTGSKGEKFPSTSPSRTTTYDIEIVTDDTDQFEAVVAFLPRDEVRQYVEECVCSAMRTQVVDAISREVSKAVEGLARDRVLVRCATEWFKAYSHRGSGSAWVRSREVEIIYDKAAPVPGGTADPAANAFLLEVRKLVRRAIVAGGGKLVGWEGEEPAEAQSDAA